MGLISAEPAVSRAIALQDFHANGLRPLYKSFVEHWQALEAEQPNAQSVQLDGQVITITELRIICQALAAALLANGQMENNAAIMEFTMVTPRMLIAAAACWWLNSRLGLCHSHTDRLKLGCGFTIDLSVESGDFWKYIETFMDSEPSAIIGHSTFIFEGTTHFWFELFGKPSAVSR